MAQEEQQRRVQDRRINPLKRWKLSPVDQAAGAKWNELTQHKNQMFERTSTDDAPWFIVRAGNRKAPRLESMRHVLSTFEYEGRGHTGQRIQPDPNVVMRWAPGT